MQKRYIPLVFFFVIMLVFLSHVGTKLAESAPTFAFAEQKTVYLTFDDGPSTVVTNRILDILKEEDIKATFFLVSDRGETRKETVKRIFDEGHSIGVHSKSHEYGVIYSSDQALLKDADACAEFIRSVTGVKPHLYRFPGGLGSKEKIKLMRAHGYRPIGWNACCRDEEIPNASAEVLLSETIKSSEGLTTVTLLCHDSAHHKATAEALPKIIKYYRDHGYVFKAY